MQCPQCSFANPPQMKFCVECGTHVAVYCDRCDAEMLPGYKFCGQCGAALGEGDRPASHSGPPASPGARPGPAAAAGSGRKRAGEPAGGEAKRPSAGERRQVTVLHCELVASSYDSEALAPDVMHGLLNRFYELAQTEIQRYEGAINRFLGQGFMALFGAPVAHEDHARRAVLAALGVAEQVSGLEEERGVRWNVRMGLDTGPVIVGGVGDMAVGEATALANQLQQLATPGTILLSGNVARQVRSHVQLKSHEPATGPDGVEIELWQAVAARSELASDLVLRSDRLSPFVGREQELAVLERARDLAAAGQGQVVTIAGDAGSGKSRLLHELYRRTFSSKGVSYLRGRCLSYGGGIPYLPLIDMIRRGSRISERDAPAEVIVKLRESLERVGLESEETLPFLLRLLDVEEGTEALDELEPQAIKSRTFAAMRRMLLAASGRSSVVVVEIEDLQWIDATSAEFLDSLIEVMAAARMLVVLTHRSGYQPRWLDRSYATQISLRRLSDEESRALVASVVERDDLPAELSGDLLDKAEGNPFFLEELARAWKERASADGGAIPDTIQGILMARLDRLPAEHKDLLRTAAVLGREFSLELVEALWDSATEIQPLLEDLQRWELVYKAPSEDRRAYFFKNALTQEVTYQSLLDEPRRTLHARAAQTLEARYAERLEDVYSLLIYHYPRAGEPAKTVHYLTRFAARAAHGFAHAEAAKALREALVEVEKLPAETRERQLVEVLLQLAESLLPLAAFPETLELFERYRERMEKLDDAALTSQYAFWLAHTYTYLGDQEQTRHYARVAIDAAREVEDQTTEGKARYVLGRDGFWSGLFKEGIENSLRAVVLLERGGEPWWQGQAYWVAGFNHFALGNFDDGIDALERACAIGEALDDYRLDASWSLGYFYASLGDSETAIELCQRGLETAQDPLNSAVAKGFLGHALLQKGDLDAAAENLAQSVDMMERAGMQQLLGWFDAFLAEVQLSSGDLETARSTAQRGLEAARAARFDYGAALALRALGQIALAEGDLAGASESLTAARQLFDERSVRFEVGRLDLDLAAVAGAEERLDEVARRCSAAARGFSELELPEFEQRAVALAAELGAPIDSQRTDR